MRRRAWLVLTLAGCGRLGFGDVPIDASVPYCGTTAGSATFCSDFDSEIDPWTRYTAAGGTYTIDDSDSRSPPNALVVATDASADASESIAQAVIEGLGPFTRATVGFDFRVEAVGTSDPVIADLNFFDGTVYHEIEYVYRAPPELAYIEDVANAKTMPMYTNSPFVGPPVGEWHRAELAFDGVADVIVVSTDGSEVLRTASAGATTGTLTLYLGITYLGGPAQPWQFRFDNVLLRAQ